MNKKVVICIGAGVGLGIGIGVAIHLVKKRKADGVDAPGALTPQPDFDEEEGDAWQEPDIEDDWDDEPPYDGVGYRHIEGGLGMEKPSLDDLDIPEEAVESAPIAFITFDEAEEEEDPEEMNEFGTEQIVFDDSGHPVFSEGDWDGEEGRIEQIWEDVYRGEEYPQYTRDVAAWFPEAGVMVNADMEPIDVVDCVGPTAFTKLVNDDKGTFYVANHPMERMYEIYVNETPFDEVVEEVYPTYCTSTEM